ncbi:aspartyl-tRNA synthetase [Lophiostoma macrostomum CBS 122681]|uniref:Aspartyl-tRNA synthetase n=1 Tax=Lophiostoma macrostomum CBS 122681 TaxID=1314788 RepID=A0A6A6TL46_9PLEO|nr:aspartyl-tRNA synthetase [Lophiostoma macrostomum CBS 122681]
MRPHYSPGSHCLVASSFEGSHHSWHHRELNIAKYDGLEISLTGYLIERKNVAKNLSFAELRNGPLSMSMQVVSSPSEDATEEEMNTHALFKSLRSWTPVTVRGIVKTRDSKGATRNSEGIVRVLDLELKITAIKALNEIDKDVIVKDGTAYPPEQRHLQLRTDWEQRGNLLFRAKAMHEARKVLRGRKFREFETPILFKSTPEGAREFLVPTRTKGLSYALPQSPQQYKQILMASGIRKYYQFARCFRDEDLRADRQPEFTQLDMEGSFHGEEDVMGDVEKLVHVLWKECLTRASIPEIFPRMTYQEAMSRYGSDKPDLRLEMEIHQIAELLPPDLVAKISPLENPAIDAFRMKLPGDPKKTRKFISDFLDDPEGKPFLDNPAGQPGIFIGDAAQPMNGLGPLGYAFALVACPPGLTTEHGELLILQARSNSPFAGGSTPIGNLRLALHKAAVAQDLIAKPSPTDYQFLWVTDFPLFSPSNDTDPGQGGTAGLSSTHHPFTAPKTAEDAELLLTAPEKAIAAHYDLVLNGVELGGGSRRIHNAAVQEFIFREVLKMRPERIEDFRHLLDVLRSGCPPHAGIALGWDRLMAVMLGKESVRDVIAFPKSGRGEDMLVKSPNQMTEEQLDTYHLRLKE